MKCLLNISLTIMALSVSTFCLLVKLNDMKKSKRKDICNIKVSDKLVSDMANKLIGSHLTENNKECFIVAYKGLLHKGHQRICIFDALVNNELKSYNILDEDVLTVAYELIEKEVM